MRVEEEYSDVLLSIESMIADVYESDSELADRDVISAIESLQRVYEKERRARGGLTPTPSGLAGTIYKRCRHICEWYLGRQADNLSEEGDSVLPPRELTMPELLRVLKRLRKSMRLWDKERGLRGYLDYVHGFIAHANT